ncbi:MAG TPA: GNAT family N-acetyltransferase [Phycisphaerae bacterium]|nr:GNAT family N-acetyltransferase [Phycisphaerae bacterium]HOB73978.1 GNAT family N-acetyltransferase [Phycisphaerae bacterium]HOJ53891.1 GNAT family N-acetyltransferase [Phycisphaerae bacterium]HOL26222.1 GNAT family N-acetyltransferase [Phycisphaerae bacterium]HPP20209.1 GNAT family N-acetyltransferase [Phycisphaerae bacterium]
MRPIVGWRSAVNDDADEVRKLVFGVLREYGLSPDPACTDADLTDIERNYHGRGGCFELLIEENGRLGGCYGLYPLAAGLCELRKMYLRKDLRGRGLGKLMLQRALAQARSLQFNRVQLETAHVLQKAITLYQSFGFRTFRPEHMSARCDCAMYLDLATLNGQTPAQGDQSYAAKES